MLLSHSRPPEESRESAAIIRKKPTRARGIRNLALAKRRRSSGQNPHRLRSGPWVPVVPPATPRGLQRVITSTSDATPTEKSRHNTPSLLHVIFVTAPSSRWPSTPVKSHASHHFGRVRSSADLFLATVRRRGRSPARRPLGRHPLHACGPNARIREELRDPVDDLGALASITMGARVAWLPGLEKRAAKQACKCAP
ncbi:hypothetical protein HPB50_009758 [Hyalomma asiaticum]|uniref:Uncharacterized protein n=1 Tax=Hyalomma asiaticum TaxID=266040 RepID=A0ACB7S1F8_HYAAI|nr:hypothetical protein HPB50_009758 [Hyalomma asiaticum]